MKILSYITIIDLTSGGPSRSIPMLIKGLAELGADVTLNTQRMKNMNTHALDETAVKLLVLDAINSEDIEAFILQEKLDFVQLQKLQSYGTRQRQALREDIFHVGHQQGGQGGDGRLRY